MSKRIGFTMIGLWIAALTFLAAQNTGAGQAQLTTQTFTVADTCRISTPDNKQATLADLKVGDKVAIHYQEQNGVAVADRIAEVVPPTGEHPKTTPPASEPHPTPPANSDLHAHGTITGIDPQGKTVTIEEKAHSQIQK
jgi:Cu/Ag efflux protein CusF